MLHFTQEQINDIVSRYANGETLQQISNNYAVSRPTIQKIVKNNYPFYTGKKRVSIAKEGQTKTCTKCGKTLLLSKFNKGNSLYGRRSICRECEHIIQNSPERVKAKREAERKRRENPDYVRHRNEMDKNRRHANEHSIKLAILRAAKSRAKAKNIEFDLDVSDITLPEMCPLLNIKLASNNKISDNSYSLDRIDSSKGYIKGNVWIISNRANAIKNNASLEELELLVYNLKKKLEAV